MFVVVLIAAIAFGVAMGGGRASRRAHRLGDDPDLAIQARRFIPGNCWGSVEYVYRPDLLRKSRGRRRVVRTTKRRGDPDRTLEGDGPSDPG